MIGRRYAPRFPAVAVALVATVLTACDGPGVVSPVHRTPIVARIGGSSISSAIAGTWRRGIFFIDEFNIARSTETTWQFGTDGTATRVVVTRNLTFGLVDVQTATGRWRVEGSTLVVDFLTPSVFQVRLAMQLTGDQLTLTGETFLRVPL